VFVHALMMENQHPETLMSTPTHDAPKSLQLALNLSNPWFMGGALKSSKHNFGTARGSSATLAPL